MARSDFIADFITVIRNAQQAGKDKVSIPASRVTVRIAEILKEEGFIHQVKPFDEGNKKFVRLHLKYIQGKRPAIQGGLGISIVSTSKGLLTDKSARREKAGGEILCSVW